MGLRKLWASVVTVAMAISLAGLTIAPARAEEGSATITGTVTLKGEPIVRGSVAITRSDGEYVHALTDGAGTYSASVPPGTYTVALYPPLDEDDDHKVEPGLEYLVTYSGDTVRKSDATRHTVAAGQTETVDIAPVAAAVVRGKVVDPSGRGLSNVTVHGFNQTRSGHARTETDSDGEYVLTSLATGEVEVSVSRRKSVARTTVMATQGSTTKAKSITLDIGLGTLTGTVKGLKKGDRVTAYDTKAKLNYEIARATKGGTLKIRAKLGPGTYRLSVDKLNLVSKTVRIRSGKQVSAGTITAPSKRNRLTGIVKGSNGKPLANARVVISNRYGIKVSSKRTDSHGKYSAPNLGRGTYQLSSRGTTGNGAKSVKVKVKAGRTAKQNLKLPKTYDVTGTVVFEGKPVAGVKVSGYTFGDKVFVGTTETDASGRFTLQGMPRGTDRVHVVDSYPGGYLDRRVKVQVKQKDELVISVKK